jgi:DMSO reductase anchor subunit
VRLEFRPPQQKGLSTPTWLPDSPNPQLTLPTTRYVTRHPEASLLAADHAEARLQPAHWPLILLLVGTQAGIGGMILAAIRSGSDPAGAAILSMLALACFGLGMIGSVAHLGQPAKAWRVWMGWRTSWLSREAMILPVFGGVAATCTARWIVSWKWPELPLAAIPQALALAGLGLTGIASLIAQSGVYVATQRWCWRASAAMPRFVGTVMSLGAVTALAVPASGSRRAELLCLLLGQLLKLGVELRAATGAASTSTRAVELRRQVQLLTETLRPFMAARVIVGLIAGVLLPAALLAGVAASSSVMVGVMVAGCVVGELLERWMFFRAATPNRMPGMP